MIDEQADEAFLAWLATKPRPLKGSRFDMEAGFAAGFAAARTILGLDPEPPGPGHDGPAHPTVILAMITTDAAGGHLTRSWPVCGCSTGGLEAKLGEPRASSYATAEVAGQMAAATRGAAVVMFRAGEGDGGD